MTIKDFRGAAKPLDKFDIPILAHRIDVSEDHLQAFLNVESRSQGFDRAGRPIILNEPHVFYRNLSGNKRTMAVAEGLAYAKWGAKPYPKTQDERYAWLQAAAKIDPEAAMKACSWGSTQILGENHALVGYPTVEEMVLAFMDDEENHVEAMVNYILATGIADDMKAERWETVARIYNGPGYKKNGYHTKMAAEFRKLRGQADTDWKPDAAEEPAMELTPTILKPVQRRLGELGYKEVGWADGTWGTKTRAAVLAFRADNGLPLVPQIDESLMAKLMLAAPRQIGEDRASTTAQDLRKAGSRTISAADKATGVGALVGIGGAITAITDTLAGAQEQLDGLTGVVGSIDGLLGSMDGLTGWLLLALGAYTVYQQIVIKRSRVEDHQTGKNPYPGGN